MRLTQKEYKLVRSGIAPHIQAQSNALTLLTQSSLTNTINLVPNDTFALSRGGTELKQSSTDKTILQDSLNQIEAKVIRVVAGIEPTIYSDDTIYSTNSRSITTHNILETSPTGVAPAIPRLSPSTRVKDSIATTSL